jgi:3-(3-hydroxy-phenyl)propionate hydroxylase
MIPGAPAADAPIVGPAGAWLLDYVGGTFTLLAFDAAIEGADVAALAHGRCPCKIVRVGGGRTDSAITLEDSQGLARKRYDALPGTIYLVRPDQHVCALAASISPVSRLRSAARHATHEDYFDGNAQHRRISPPDDFTSG